jgi:hypothetical protein
MGWVRDPNSGKSLSRILNPELKKSTGFRILNTLATMQSTILQGREGLISRYIKIWAISKEIKYTIFQHKKLLLKSQKYELDPGSEFRKKLISDPGSRGNEKQHRIPDP